MGAKRDIPLDLNESYWLLSEELLHECVAPAALDASTYPRYESLRSELAAYVQAPLDHLLLVPGSDAAIEILFRICSEKKLRPLIPLPSFTMYEQLAARYSVGFEPLYYTESGDTFAFPIEQCLARIRSGAVQIVFLSQPNNPLGSRIPTEHLAELLAAAKAANVLVVLDEAYAEFDPDALAQSEDNIIVLRTLSKSFGLAGIRIGYCIASPEWIRELAAYQLPWPVAGTSVAIARRALALQQKFAERRALLIQERELFARELATLSSVKVFSSCTNFLLVRVDSAASVASALAQEGIRVALGESKALDMQAKALLKGTLRMSVPSPEDRPRIIDALRAALDK